MQYLLLPPSICLLLQDCNTQGLASQLFVCDLHLASCCKPTTVEGVMSLQTPLPAVQAAASATATSASVVAVSCPGPACHARLACLMRSSFQRLVCDGPLGGCCLPCLFFPEFSPHLLA